MSEKLLITRAAFHVMKSRMPWHARDNARNIAEAKSRDAQEGEQVSLGNTYGDIRLDWWAARHEGQLYLKVDLDQRKKKPFWSYHGNEIYLEHIPQSMMHAHMKACADGKLLAKDLLGLEFLGDRRVLEVKPPSDFTMIAYDLSGHWSDGALEDYPVTMADWRNEFPS